MIMCTSDILCVTSRKLCKEDFLTRIRRIAACHPAGIILREKDLPEAEYHALAEQVMRICREHGTRCILHSFVDAAIALQADAIHLPLPLLCGMTEAQKARFKVIGASCHSVEDALEAQILGCSYITAGHVFRTGCKEGLPGRGLTFLENVCAAVRIPVYGIGGIDGSNISEIRSTDARGACLMSSLMVCEDVPGFMKTMEERT